MSPHPVPSTAAQIVRHLLSTHGYLKSAQLYPLGLAEFPSPSVLAPPRPKPTRVVDEHGNVRMRKAANVEGGRIPYMPMPEAQHKDHPFQSMKYFKHQILENLERLNLIRKIPVRVPLTGPSLLAAEAQAEKERRRARRIAIEIFMRLKKGGLSRVKNNNIRVEEREGKITVKKSVKLPEDAERLLAGKLEGEELRSVEEKYEVRQIEVAKWGMEWGWEMVLPEEEGFEAVSPVQRQTKGRKLDIAVKNYKEKTMGKSRSSGEASTPRGFGLKSSTSASSSTATISETSAPHDEPTDAPFPSTIPFARPTPPPPSLLHDPRLAARWESAKLLELQARRAAALADEEIVLRKELRAKMWRGVRENKKLAAGAGREARDRMVERRMGERREGWVGVEEELGVVRGEREGWGDGWREAQDWGAGVGDGNGQGGERDRGVVGGWDTELEKRVTDELQEVMRAR